MKTWTLIQIIFILPSLSMVQLEAQEAPVHQQISDLYENFREPSLTHRRFKHSDLQPLIAGFRDIDGFSVRNLGKSIEGRDIDMISVGRGPVSVLLWSQMHGNEPTATQAIFDILNFLKGNNGPAQFKSSILQNLTLHFIPMLNPDGAEKFERRNAIGVDLNRDALRLTNPEARILKLIRDELEADWGFNLHDQSRYTSAGIHPNTASISFLAPAYNFEKEVNASRQDAMQLIGVMNKVLQTYIPGRVARYNDDFEPRAFGDNIQKWGTRTILIESGGFVDDREKQYLRKMNCIALLVAFSSIADGSFENTSRAVYEQIPFNAGNTFHDLIMRNLTISLDGNEYLIDIAMRHGEVEVGNEGKFYLRSGITDIGDLSTSFGYEEFDATGYQVKLGSVYPTQMESLEQVQMLDPLTLIRNAYTYVAVKKGENVEGMVEQPIRLVNIDFSAPSTIQMGGNPSLILFNSGTARYLLANGKVYDLEKDKNLLKSIY